MKIMSDAEYFGIKLVVAFFAIAMVAMFFRSAQYNDRGVIQVVEPYAETDPGPDIDGSLTADLSPDCRPQLADKGPGAKPRVDDGVASRRMEPDTVCDTTNRPYCDTVSTEYNHLDPQNEVENTAQLPNML